MSDLVMILTGAISLVTIILVALIAWKGSTPAYKGRQSKPKFVEMNGPLLMIPSRGQDKEEQDEEARPVPRPRRNVRNRMHGTQVMDDDDEMMLEDMIVMPDGKIGAKKRKKLEMKAEKRAQRDRELEDREERKQRQAQEEERRKQEEQLQKEVEAQKEAEEQRLREEKERQELEEYLKLKEMFSVEDEGYEATTDEEARNKLQEFIDHIKRDKVVILEDLASKFQLKTQDCIDRIQCLLADETLVGVIDDRGKFIYIVREELEEVARFISQRGRVSISELVDSSNSLINLTPA